MNLQYELARCIAEQREAKGYLDQHGFDAGAWLGLCDWLMEECLVRQEMAAQQTWRSA